MPNTILVTGGSGFIGSNFVVSWLAHEPCGVVNLDLLTYAGNQHNLSAVAANPAYKFVRGDIADAALAADVFQRYRPAADDSTKIETELGWRPRESFETGIRKTVCWYLENLDWVANVTTGAYQHWIAANYAARG